MSTRIAAWLAWSSCVLSLMLTLVSLLLFALNLARPDAHVFDFWLEDAVVAVLYSTVGAFVASRRPRNLVSWLLCLFGLLGAMRHFFSQYAIFALQAASGPLGGGEAFAWMAHFLWTPYQGLIVFAALLFPNGQLPNARWRWLAWATGIGIVAGTVTVSFSSIPYTGLGHVHNPVGMWGAGASHTIECLCVVFLLVASSALLVRLHGATNLERQQIKWVVYAGTVLIIGDFLKYVLFFTFDLSWALWPGWALLAAGLVSVPVAMGIAILRYRLYEIDIIINRTLVYGSLSMLLLVVFAVTDELLENLFSLIWGKESVITTLVAAVAVAVLFEPLRRRIQAVVDRFVQRRIASDRTSESH